MSSRCKSINDGDSYHRYQRLSSFGAISLLFLLIGTRFSMLIVNNNAVSSHALLVFRSSFKVFSVRASLRHRLMLARVVEPSHGYVLMQLLPLTPLIREMPQRLIETWSW